MCKLKTITLIATLLTTALFVFIHPTAADEPNNKPLTVFAVRHAEKVEFGKDPGLTEAGRKRAKALADHLQSIPIDYIHSSNYKRTNQTAAPAVKKFGLTVQQYDPKDMQGLVEKLRKTGGRHLVVGHSNTTPKLVQLLGGDPGDPIDEKNEYDRLYIITIAADGTVNTVLMRYGFPSILNKKKKDIESHLTEAV